MKLATNWIADSGTGNNALGWLWRWRQWRLSQRTAAHLYSEWNGQRSCRGRLALGNGNETLAVTTNGAFAFTHACERQCV